MAHSDLQRRVSGREIWSPERIDEMNDSKRKDYARAENHEHFCGQDALPGLRRIADLVQFCGDFFTCSSTVHILSRIIL